MLNVFSFAHFIALNKVILLMRTEENLDENKQPALLVTLAGLIPIKQLAIIDTGCSESYIFVDADPETCQAFRKTGSRVKSYSVGNEIIDVPEIEITIILNGFKFNVLMGLSNHHFGRFQMILGSKFLADHNLSLHLFENKFIIKKINSTERIINKLH